MVTSVQFILYNPSTVKNVTAELAAVVVGNAARDFKIGILIVGQNEKSHVIPMQPLSVGLVRRIRLEAADVFDKLSNDKLLIGTHPDEAYDIGMEAIKRHQIEFDELVIPHDDYHVLRRPEVTRLTGLKNARFPKKAVKMVKVFSGDFTIGDPKDPLLKIGAEMYPATRKAKIPDIASYVNDRKVTHTSTLRTDEGDSVDPNSVQRGYMYLKELVLVDDDLQKLMDAEFEGAEPWPIAFEMLAVVDAVPPWLVLDKTDYVVGKTGRDQIFWEAMNQALLDSGNNVLARLCHEPRKSPNGEKKLKGKLELVVLQPRKDGQLTCTRVPFKEEFKSYYKFSEIPTEPLPEEEELDEMMDDLVNSMTSYDMPIPLANPTIARIDQFLIDMISRGDAKVEPMTDVMEKYTISRETSKLADELMKKFGIVERAGKENYPANVTSAMDNDTDSFHFI